MKKRKLCIYSIFFTGVAFFLYCWHKLGSPDLRVKKQIKNETPTLFIHGYSGSRLSLGPMIKRFSKYGWGKKSAVIVVGNRGKIKITGNPAIKGGLIQVLFAKSRMPVNVQSTWLYHLMKLLYTKYQIKEVNFIAHSQGGVTVLHYLSQHAFDTEVAHVKKVVTLGAPFNDFETGKTTRVIERNTFETLTPLFQKIKQHSWRFTHDVEFMNIAGDKTDGSTSDGEVAVISVQALRYILQGALHNYHEFIITGKKAGHRNLHENQQVDKLIGRFLFSVELINNLQTYS